VKLVEVIAALQARRAEYAVWELYAMHVV